MDLYGSSVRTVPSTLYLDNNAGERSASSSGRLMHVHPGAALDTGTADKTVYLQCEPNKNCENIPVLSEE